MITKTVKRYYCEHCGKGGQTKAIADHEKSCFQNPERVCRLCVQHSLPQPPMPELIKAAMDHGLDGLRALTDCPACITAAVIQVKSEEQAPCLRFDYKAEIKSFMERRAAV